MKRNSQYALYKGEKLVGIGTKKELAELLKVRVETIAFYTTPTHRKRSKNGYCVVKIEEEKMKGEILDIGTAQELAGNEKEIERLKRDKNFAEERLKILQRKYDKMQQRNTFLESRNKILELVESYLPHRINVISKMNDARYDYAILEIKKLSDALDTEKEKLENKGDGEDEWEWVQVTILLQPL